MAAGMRSVMVPTVAGTSAAASSWNVAIAALPHLSVMCVLDSYIMEREMREQKKMKRKETEKKKMTVEEELYIEALLLFCPTTENYYIFIQKLPTNGSHVRSPLVVSYTYGTTLKRTI
ncbi:hypothetical protein RIF29_16494 [Crotalaria pallida]|uniref:Uncharacterized protein n=1 Tax=Crotalaria pallida TaxID=3830 RepID=A0AAN9IC34_CROPI